MQADNIIDLVFSGNHKKYQKGEKIIDQKLKECVGGQGSEPMKVGSKNRSLLIDDEDDYKDSVTNPLDVISPDEHTWLDDEIGPGELDDGMLDYDEIDEAIDQKIIESEYQDKFRSTLKQFGVKSINELSPEQKKEFFNKLKNK